jgi:hypothetical protein
MGIDAEDGGPGGHGPISVYESVISSGILANVGNGGSGILVIGGGKNPFDSPTLFWDQIGTDLGVAITYVNGAANITSQSFAGFAMLAVVSDEFNTFNGLTNDENTALSTRANDVSAFVNGGGGLLGFSSCALGDPYGYLSIVGTFVCTSSDHADITPTADGLAIGITDALDICCWHDTYTTFPSFLNVLATDNGFGGGGSGQASAIGGTDIVLPGQIDFDPGSLLALNEPGTNHTVTVGVVDENGNPLAGVQVDFSVLSGPNAGAAGSGSTDAAGQASFTYASGGTAGVDVIEACFDDPNDDPDRGNICTTVDAQKFWDADCQPNDVPDTCDIDCLGFDGACGTAYAASCGLSADVDLNGKPDECNQNPVCTGATADPGTLWPPNHTLVAVAVTGVTDADGDPITITATDVTQDEAVTGTGIGSGNTTPDASLSPLAVRAERNGNPKTPGNGRVYQIDFTAEDGQGGSCTGSVTVCVPHDQRPTGTCVDDGELYDSIP